LIRIRQRSFSSKGMQTGKRPYQHMFLPYVEGSQRLGRRPLLLGKAPAQGEERNEDGKDKGAGYEPDETKELDATEDAEKDDDKRDLDPRGDKEGPCQIIDERYDKGGDSAEYENQGRKNAGEENLFFRSYVSPLRAHVGFREYILVLAEPLLQVPRVPAPSIDRNMARGYS
jgi:hypothetical protein